MLNKNKANRSKADVKDGALILYLPTALKPCVWRMDLATLGETSIEVDEKDGLYILATRDINGVTKPIAAFNNGNDAQTAVSLALKALMSGDSRKSVGGITAKYISSLLKIGVILLIAFLIWDFFFRAPVEMPLQIMAEDFVEEQAPAPAVQGIEMGVPVDVDSLFETLEE